MNHNLTPEQMQWHREQAITGFNAAWELLDKQNRSQEDNLTMIHMAHASRYHWGKIGTPLEFARGEWQVSRVYAVLKMGESALFHAKASLQYCQENAIASFDLAFAYEANARAYAVLGNVEAMQEYIQHGKKAAVDIEDEDDCNYFLGELATVQITE